MQTDYEIRRLTKADRPLVERILYLAAMWRPSDAQPIEAVMRQPELIIYHDGWGRSGDIGVAAERDGVFLGGGYCRLFTESTHGYGFVGPEVPELALAVEPPFRGQGLGAVLMEALANAARDAGCTQLTLSVENDNPARRLYRRLGYQDLDPAKPGHPMILDLQIA